jgi:hypothetical protein
MARWEQFANEAPEMAEAGRNLIYMHGVGLGYLATVRPDGGPRLHPFCPVVAAGGLYGLIGVSPKRGDLARNGHYAIHTFPIEDGDDEFYVTGRAHRIKDESVMAEVSEAYHSTGATSSGDEWFFEFEIERALLAIYKKRAEGNTWPPTYTKWRATQ